MNRIAILAGLFSGTAAWMILRQQNNQSLLPFSRLFRKTVPAQVAAEKLRMAWADHHTTV